MKLEWITITLVIIVLALSSYTYNLIDHVNQLQSEVARLKASNRTNSHAVATMKEQLNKANEEINYRKEIINEIIKNHPDWCNAELPFDFNIMCKTTNSTVPSTNRTTE